MKLTATALILSLATTSAWSEGKFVKPNHVVESAGGLTVAELLPTDAILDGLIADLELENGAFRLYLPTLRFKNRSLEMTASFSSRKATVDEVRSLTKEDGATVVGTVQNHRCSSAYAIVSMEIRCLVGDIVVSLSKAVPIGLDESGKRNEIDLLLQEASKFPFDRLTNANTTRGSKDATRPDATLGLAMSVPGLNGKTVADIVPKEMSESKNVHLEFRRNDSGYVIEFVDYQSSTNANPVKLYYSDQPIYRKGFERDQSKTDAKGQLVGKRFLKNLDVNGSPCIAIGSQRQSRLDCLVGKTVLSYYVGLDHDEDGTDISGVSMVKVIEAAKATPFENFR